MQDGQSHLLNFINYYKLLQEVKKCRKPKPDIKNQAKTKVR